MDYVNGTDKNFRKSESFKKHKFLIPYVTKQIADKCTIDEQKNDKSFWKSAEETFICRIKNQEFYFIFHCLNLESFADKKSLNTDLSLQKLFFNEKQQFLYVLTDQKP